MPVAAATAVAVLLAAGCGEPPPPRVEVPPAAVAPPPPPPPPNFAPIEPVRVGRGESVKIPVELQRNGNQGFIEITVDSPPAGLTAEPVSIAADATGGELLVKVDESLGDDEYALTVPVTAIVNGVSTQGTFQVVVPRFEPPAFRIADGILFVPGVARTVELRCDRNGFRGPLEVAIGENPPAGVACEIEPLTADADTTSATITMPADTADGPVRIPLVTTIRGRPAVAEIVAAVKRHPFRVETLGAVMIAPGETRRLTLPIMRDGYGGPIELVAEGLPEGVVMEPATAPADAETIAVELRCAEGSAAAVRTAAVRCAAGPFTIDSPLVVRISSADDRFLPEAVLGIPRAELLLRQGSFGGRMTAESKRALRDVYGGTNESDAAVMRGLAWLASVQQSDGGWLLKGAPDASGQPGEPQPQENRVAATAFALLAFLGEGITHKAAPSEPAALAGYKSVVERGLVFLATIQDQGRGAAAGSFGAGMYAQALATITFCEAYALSRDQKVRFHAQKSVKFLLDAQDPGGGGWRYSRRQPGDLSVTGWVVIALRSAQLANVSAKASQLREAEKFVRACAAGPDDAPESQYAYEPGRESKPAMTAAGLLSRLYLGWSREDPQLLVGRDFLMQKPPPADPGPLGDIYHYYYATQVLHHLEGEAFDTWNHRMRQHLVRTQTTEGELAGSWDPQGASHGEKGGRVYATAMALLTLQIYYRHLPMFRELPETASLASEAAGEDESPEAGGEE